VDVLKTNKNNLKHKQRKNKLIKHCGGETERKTFNKTSNMFLKRKCFEQIKINMFCKL